MRRRPIVKVNVLNQWTYHARLYRSAEYVAHNEDMNLVQLVSFGCGIDAITTDEMRTILERNGKLYTQIKIDEINNLGVVRIRLRQYAGGDRGTKSGKGGSRGRPRGGGSGISGSRGRFCGSVRRAYAGKRKE